MLTSLNAKRLSIGNLFGGTRTAPPGEGFGKLKSLFRRPRAPARPRLAAGPLPGDLLLKRVGARHASLHLGRLHAASPRPRVAAKAPTAAAPIAAPATAAPAPSPTPAPAAPIDALSAKIEAARGLVDAAARFAEAPPPKGDVAAWSKHEAATTVAQQKAGAEMEACLKTANALLGAATGDDAQTLAAMKRDLVALGVKTHFPRLFSDFAATTFSRDEAVAALKCAERAAPGKFKGVLAENAATLARQIDAFNADASETPGGGKVDAAAFGRLLGSIRETVDAARLLSMAMGATSAEAAAAARPALEALDALAALCAARAPLVALTQTLAGAESDYAAVQRQVGEPAVSPFPLNAALRAFAAWPPRLFADARSDAPQDRARAVRSLAAMAGLFASGETPALALGLDAEFDKAAGVFANRHFMALADARVVADYKALHPDWDPATPPPQDLADLRASARTQTRAAVLLRQELTTANRRLEGLLKIPAWGGRGALVFGEGAAGSVAKDANLLAALAKRSGPGAGRDAAFLLAQISDLETRAIAAEQRLFGLHGAFFFAPPGVDVGPEKWTGLQNRLIDAGVQPTGPEEIEAARRQGVPLAANPAIEAKIAAFPEPVKSYALSFPPDIRARFGDLRLRPLPSPDPDHPLAHVGVTNKDLRKLGLTDTDAAALRAKVAGIARQGVLSMAEVKETVAAVNAAVDKVLRSELGQELIDASAGASAAAEARRLLQDLLLDAVILHASGARTAPDLTGNLDLAANDPRVVARFTYANGQKLPEVLGQTGIQELALGAERYVDLEMRVVDLVEERLRIQKDSDAAKRFLQEQASPAPGGLGLEIDSDDPRGLSSARAILGALGAHRRLEAAPDDADARKLLDDSLNQLRGFDAQRMRRPWTGKIAAMLGRGAKPSFEDLARLEAAAEAIVQVRQSAPLALDDTRRRIAAIGGEMNDLLAERARHRDAISHVRQQARAALLSVWPRDARDVVVRDGKLAAGFDPSAHRDKVVKQLEAWGLDVKTFAPEIDSVLYGSVGKSDIASWRAESTFSKQGKDYLKETAPMLTPRRAAQIVGHREMDRETKRALLSLIDGMRDGDKLNLKTGQKITLDSGKIPVEPTGLAGVRAKLAGSRIGQFEIEMGGDGYKLNLRVGNEGRASVEAVVGQNFDLGGPVVQAKIEGAVGVDGAHARLNGVSISFPKSDAGRESLLALVHKMTENQEIKMSDLASASDVARSRETQTRAGATARFGAKVEATARSGAGEEKQGGGATVDLAAAAGKGWKNTDTGNINKRTLKGEVETSVAIGASAGLYARLYNPLNYGTGQAARDNGARERFGNAYNMESGVGNTDLANIGASATWNYTLKWKTGYTGDGMVTSGEKVRQTSAASGPIFAMAAVIDAGLRSRIDAPKPGSPDEALSRDIGLLMGAMTDNDVLAVTYGLKADAMAQANALLGKAKTLRRDGAGLQAEALETRARLIVDDEASYHPTKIALVANTIDKRENVVANARFIQWGQFSDGKMERPAMILAVPAAG
ncbi:MAG: hypothetical protein ACR652_02455 [Methylocystis sp.]|uniref:hypothetical protein n=1 Tax=Methylocystis sp. TaxID=1911079 RepID=UPI003DA1F728